MKYKIIDIIVAITTSLLLIVYMDRPYWEASALATSRSDYLIWSLSSSWVTIIILSGIAYILWKFFQNLRTPILLMGVITVVFGNVILMSAPAMLERAAPELRPAGKASWLDTPIRTTPKDDIEKKTHDRAVVARLRLEDGTTVQALTFSVLDERGFLVEIHRDSGGTYWVGDPAKDKMRESGGGYIVCGSMLISTYLLSLFAPIRRFMRRLVRLRKEMDDEINKLDNSNPEQ